MLPLRTLLPQLTVPCCHCYCSFTGLRISLFKCHHRSLQNRCYSINSSPSHLLWLMIANGLEIAEIVHIRLHTMFFRKEFEWGRSQGGLFQSDLPQTGRGDPKRAVHLKRKFSRIRCKEGRPPSLQLQPSNQFLFTDFVSVILWQDFMR